MAPTPTTRVVRPSPDLTTLSSVTDDTIVTRLRERVSVNAPWSRISNSLLVYVNRFNGEADQFPLQGDPEGEPGLHEIGSRIVRWMRLDGNTEQTIVLLYVLCVIC
jgi:myo-inositol-hexaphosphate 3-phosphohydrolase